MSGKPTWICTAMRKNGDLTQDQVDRLHRHLYRAFWKRPWSFMQYILFGKLIVLLANRVGTSWSIWKPFFFDEVMAEPDPVKAVDLYGSYCWELFRVVRQRLVNREVNYGNVG